MMIAPEPDCRRCDLCRRRHNIVLPAGSPDSKVVFVGEAPGENEDLQGRPFIGRAGKILEEAMAEAGFTRDDIIITNTVKCRPPANRNPMPEEMAACRPFLESELKGRSLIVGLGRFACQDLLGYSCSMGSIANKIVKIDVGGEKIDFLPTYHPAACIYHPESLTFLKEAMVIVRSRL